MDMNRNRNCGCEVANSMICENNNSSDCRNHMKDSSSLGKMAIAMGYVPWQYFNTTYEPAKALKVGTIFPELDKPFYGRKGARR